MSHYYSQRLLSSWWSSATIAIAAMRPSQWGSSGVTIAAIVVMLVSGIGGLPAIAAPVSPPAITVHLGTTAGDLRFEPDHLTFTAGQRYSLVLDNPSPTKHYFTAKDFADAIWTQKVQAGPVEIKGAIHELELQPTGVAEWVFVPQKPGVYELYCVIPGHREAGMRGTITITAA